jgi:hypothetical protein
MDKKLFKRLTKSMRQHAKIARGELPPSRVTSRDSSNDMSPELRESRNEVLNVGKLRRLARWRK